MVLQGVTGDYPIGGIGYTTTVKYLHDSGDTLWAYTPHFSMFKTHIPVWDTPVPHICLYHTFFFFSLGPASSVPKLTHYGVV